MNCFSRLMHLQENNLFFNFGVYKRYSLIIHRRFLKRIVLVKILCLTYPCIRLISSGRYFEKRVPTSNAISGGSQCYNIITAFFNF